MGSSTGGRNNLYALVSISEIGEVLRNSGGCLALYILQI